jgi:hypothetical protein
MAHQPGANVADLYNNLLSSPPFMGFIAAPGPNDFAVGIGYPATTENGLATPTAIAVDAGGNAWITDAPGVIILGPQGSVRSATGGYTCSGPAVAIALGPSSVTPETAWVINSTADTVNGVSSSGSCTPITSPDDPGDPSGWNFPAAISAAGTNLYVVDQGTRSLEGFTLSNSGAAPSASSLGFSNPDILAIDNSANIWVGDQANGVSFPGNPPPPTSIYTVNSTGMYTAFTGNLLFNTQDAMAVGAFSNLWIADPNGGQVLQFTTAVTPTSATATAGTAFNNPSGGIDAPVGLAVDGSGIVWVANQDGANISAISPGPSSSATPTTLSPDGTSTTNGGYSGGGVISSPAEPTGIAVDPSGNVWVSISGGNYPVVEFIGIGSPTITPLADGVGADKIATLP